ncbi:MAG: M2 family metallopeptidase [bacterium]|nr:M2 family metallopeptidase [bacterium]
MKVRLLAGIGMFLLAAGMLAVFFLTDGKLPELLTSKNKTESDFDFFKATTAAEDGPRDVDKFLDEYNANYRRLWTEFEGANWNAASNINEENTAAKITASKAMADYVGSRKVIEQLKNFRGRLDLTQQQDRQIEIAWQLAAHYPGTIPSTVDKLIKTEAALEDSLYSFEYKLVLEGKEPQTLTPNEIDDLLLTSRDLATRQAVWETSKTVGPKLKDNLVEAQTLRNAVAREMGYSSFYALEVADYDLTSEEMSRLMDDVVAGIMPLYQQLHCWVKYELAARYNVEEVPQRIPAHWLGNRWGQEWPGIIDGIDLDGMFRDVQPQWMIEQAERFYTSMGFEPLPLTFWGRSDLFELPADATRKKNTHASAWHIDLDQDVRSLMSVKSNFNWFQTTHHELGHIYYYLAYSREDVPPILRTGANRAFHEGVGTLIELASSQVPYMQQIGLLSLEETPEEIRWLLTQALQGPVVFLPFACGTMAHWEHDFYEEDLPRHQMNTRWWEYVARYQGLEPPTARGEEYCDPATKTHIIDDPAQYYDYALSSVILHQLHRYICREILDQDVRSANYFGNQQVGMYLHSILQLGATKDWKVVMQQATGEDLSSSALLEYFDPLMVWLQEQNQGREVGF